MDEPRHPPTPSNPDELTLKSDRVPVQPVQGTTFETVTVPPSRPEAETTGPAGAPDENVQTPAPKSVRQRVVELARAYPVVTMLLAAGLVVALWPASRDETQPGREHPSTAARFRGDAWMLPDEPLLGLVEIQGGLYRMGTDPTVDRAVRPEEQPRHEVVLPTFFIARYEVTVGQYKACVAAGVCNPQEPLALQAADDEPVRYVSWYEAFDYCDWLTGQLSAWRGTPFEITRLFRERARDQAWRITLPSEAEWERAAHGLENTIYPWGNVLTPAQANYGEAALGAPTPVGAYPGGTNAYGMYDVVGNVAEWTRSAWGEEGTQPRYAYPYRANDGREDRAAAARVMRVVRGGSYDDAATSVRVTARMRTGPSSRTATVGFRVALSLVAGTPVAPSDAP